MTPACEGGKPAAQNVLKNPSSVSRRSDTAYAAATLITVGIAAATVNRASVQRRSAAARTNSTSATAPAAMTAGYENQTSVTLTADATITRRRDGSPKSGRASQSTSSVSAASDEYCFTSFE